MRLLAEYLLQGRLSAGLASGLLLAVALLAPPLQPLFLPLSGVPIALTAMRLGALPGVQVLLPGLVPGALLLLGFGISPLAILEVALFFWLPVLCCALVLRGSESQGLMLAACAGLAALLVFSLHLRGGDLDALWRPQLEMLTERRGTPITTEMIERLSALIIGLVGVVSMWLLIGTVWIARWLQSVYCMPGGFVQELRSLHLPRLLAVVPAFLLLSPAPALEVGGSLLRDLGLLFGVLYVLAGCASLVRRGVPGIWLVLGALPLLLLSGRYALLLLLPIAVLGLIDSLLRRTF